MYYECAVQSPPLDRRPVTGHQGVGGAGQARHGRMPSHHSSPAQGARPQCCVQVRRHLHEAR
eukprot:3151413-Pyramimonas_sp.AAC.1